MSPVGGDARIPTLAPVGLDLVPGWNPATETGSAASGWRGEWFRWRAEVEAYRQHLHKQCASSTRARAVEVELCKADPNRFVTLWGWIHEPRPRKGEPMVKPFTQMAWQVQLNDHLLAAVADPDPREILQSKARGLGLTWNFTAATLPMFLWHDWAVLCVSRNEDMVDRPNDLASIFGKYLFNIDRLPPWMLPEGWARKDHRHKNVIHHPGGIAQIVGQPTTAKAGRGMRSTVVFVDEAAFIPDLLRTAATLSPTTDCLVMGSTESLEEGDDWWVMWHAKKTERPEDCWELDWFLNPYYDDEWREREERRFREKGDTNGFQREYLRLPHNPETQVYAMAEDVPWVDAAYDDALPLVLAGIDPGRADDTAIVWAQPVGGDMNATIRWIDTYERNLMPAEFYAHILTGIPPDPTDPLEKVRPDDFNARDHQVMEWTRSLSWSPDRVRYFMDPTGANKDASGLSFHDRLVTESLRLRKRESDRMRKDGLDAPTPRPVAPIYREIQLRNRHDVRRLAHRQVLMRSEFADTPGVRRLREAHLHYRFRKQTPNATSEPTPVHDQWSHLVTAAEYLSVYASLGMDRPRVKAGSPAEQQWGPPRGV